MEPIPGARAGAEAGPHDDLGMRGAKLPDDAAIRVLMLGGAWVYGAGMPADEAPPAKLGRILASKNPRSAVGNGGCPGHAAAAAMLRFHFMLAAVRATHVVYVPGSEDIALYASREFAPDLGHFPRPWTGKALAEFGNLTDAGGAAFQRDVTSLEVICRMNNARAVFASPSGTRFAPFRAIVEKVAKQRQAAAVALPEDADIAIQTIAHAIIPK